MLHAIIVLKPNNTITKTAPKNKHKYLLFLFIMYLLNPINKPTDANPCPINLKRTSSISGFTTAAPLK